MTIAAIRSRTTAFTLATLVITILPVVWATSAQPVSPDEGTLAGLVNTARASADLPALTLDAGLSDAARRQSAAMAAAGRLFHTADLGRTVGAVVTGWTSAAENSGVGPTLDEVHARLLVSPPHRANIVGAYNMLGVGVVYADGRVWVTELFVAGPVPVAPPVSAVEPAVAAAQVVEAGDPAAAEPMMSSQPITAPVAIDPTQLVAYSTAPSEIEVVEVSQGRGERPARSGTQPLREPSPQPVGEPAGGPAGGPTEGPPATADEGQTATSSPPPPCTAENHGEFVAGSSPARNDSHDASDVADSDCGKPEQSRR